MAAKTTNSYSIDFDSYSMNDFDNVDFKSQPYILYDSLKGFHKFFVPKGIDRDNAYEIIMRLMVIFVYLNPTTSEAEIAQVTRILNSKAINTMMHSEIIMIVDDLLYLRATGGLKDVISPNVERNYLINPSLSEDEKRKYKAELSNVIQSRNKRDKIIEALEKWQSHYGKPTSQAISRVTGIPKKTIDNYGNEIKEAKQEATKLMRVPKANNTLVKLKAAMKGHDLSKGLPTYQDVAIATGYSLDTVKSYGKYLKPLKADLKEKKKAQGKLYSYFAPFDGSLEDICTDIARTTYKKADSFKGEETKSIAFSYYTFLSEPELKDAS